MHPGCDPLSWSGEISDIFRLDNQVRELARVRVNQPGTLTVLPGFFSHFYADVLQAASPTRYYCGTIACYAWTH